MMRPAVSAFSSRTLRAVTLTLALVVLTMTVAPAVASARGAALTSKLVVSALAAPVPGTTCSRAPGIALTVDSDLRLPSNASAWAIDRFLALATPLPPLGEAFKLAEARYKVNALYLLAHAMLESGFGRSYIAQNFKNLFGWTAYDRDPVAFATRFPSFAASVDYVAMRVSQNYLDPDGIYYGGAPTLRGMHRYATDPLWESSIARIANSICLATLDDRGLELTSSLAATQLKPGETTELTVAATPAAALPEGLRLAARAKPIADASSPAGRSGHRRRRPCDVLADACVQRGRRVPAAGRGRFATRRLHPRVHPARLRRRHPAHRRPAWRSRR